MKLVYEEGEGGKGRFKMDGSDTHIEKDLSYEKKVGLTDQERSDVADGVIEICEKAGASEIIFVAQWEDDFGVGTAAGDRFKLASSILGLIYRLYGPEGMDILGGLHEGLKAMAKKDKDAAAKISTALAALHLLTHETGLPKDLEEFMRRSIIAQTQKAVDKAVADADGSKEDSSAQEENPFSNLDEIPVDR